MHEPNGAHLSKANLHDTSTNEKSSVPNLRSSKKRKSPNAHLGRDMPTKRPLIASTLAVCVGSIAVADGSVVLRCLESIPKRHDKSSSVARSSDLSL